MVRIEWMYATHQIVDGGERAVIFDRFRGVLPKTVGEGTHFRIPFIQVHFSLLFLICSILTSMIFVRLLVKFLLKQVLKISKQWVFLSEC